MVLPGTSSTRWMILAGTVLLLGSITVGYEFGKRRKNARGLMESGPRLRSIAGYRPASIRVNEDLV